MLYVGIFISKKTGMAPNCRIGLTVVGKLAASVITSSPCFIAFSPNLEDVNVENATRFADEPEFTVSKHLTPKNEDNFFLVAKPSFHNVFQNLKAFLILEVGLKVLF